LLDPLFLLLFFCRSLWRISFSVMFNSGERCGVESVNFFLLPLWCVLRVQHYAGKWNLVPFIKRFLPSLSSAFVLCMQRDAWKWFRVLRPTFAHEPALKRIGQHPLLPLQHQLDRQVSLQSWMSNRKKPEKPPPWHLCISLLDKKLIAVSQCIQHCRLSFSPFPADLKDTLCFPRKCSKRRLFE